MTNYYNRQIIATEDATIFASNEIGHSGHLEGPFETKCKGKDFLIIRR